MYSEKFEAFSEILERLEAGNSPNSESDSYLQHLATHA
jgi:hypothetical protein